MKQLNISPTLGKVNVWLKPIIQNYWYTNNITDWESEWDDYGFLTNFYDLLPDHYHSYDGTAMDRGYSLHVTIIREDGTVDTTNNNGEAICRIPCAEGLNTFIIYSNGTEYMNFNNYESLQISATTRSSDTMEQPDLCFFAILENINCYKYEGGSVNDLILEASLKPCTFRYLFHLELSDESIIPIQIRFAISGMGSEFYFKTETVSDPKTLLIDYSKTPTKTMEFSVYSFGTYPLESNIFNIEYKTSSGNFGSVSIDVTDQLVGQSKGGVIICRNVTLPNLEDPNQVFTVSFETDNPNYEVQLVFGYNFYQSNKLEFQVNYGDSFYNAIEAETGIQVAVVPKISSQLIGDEEGTDGAKEWKCFDKDGNELSWGGYEQTSSGLSRLLSDSTIHIYKDHRFVAYCV